MTAEKLPNEIREVMDSGIPLVLATCAADGTPNVTIISRAYYVDPQTVAVSFQFFNKTTRNVRENPRAFLSMGNIRTAEFWQLEIEYDHSEQDGPIFEEMDMHIEAIASATGMAGIFKLQAADIYRVKSVTKIEAR
jgi:hypothetical protein